MKIEWNDKSRKVLAVALYVVGVAWVLFVAYEDRHVPNSILQYPLLFVGGMVLVVVAALLWPVVRGQGESEQPGDNHENSDAGAA